MCTVADLLIPLFTSATVGVKFAQAVARSALDDYRPETGADYVNVARTLAFSLSALALLGKAAAPDMPMPEKMRVFGRANALNRSADQSERTMMQRRRSQNACPEQSPTPAHAARPSEPDPAADLAEVEVAVAQAVAIFTANCSVAKTPAEATEALRQTTPAPASAIHYPSARSAHPSPHKPHPPGNAATPLAHIPKHTPAAAHPT